jgi:phosphatidylglycerophosphatase A
LSSIFLNKNFLRYVATLGPVGFLPHAPGTYGTLVAYLLVVLIKPSDLFLFVIFLLSVLIGLPASDKAEKVLGVDSGKIVIDEFCGYLLAVLLVPREGLILFGAFVLFRLFDIIKPPPIRRIERTLPGGIGVMADDLVAAVYVNVCLQVAWRLLR